MNIKSGNFLIILGFVFLFNFCANKKLSTVGKLEKELVSTFLTEMKNNHSKTDYINYISPQYLQENNIMNPNDYKVNSYGLDDFQIYNYLKEERVVQVKIWGKNKVWVHDLDFKVREENKRLYFVPSKISSDFIHPWNKIQTFINKK